ncbi:hypothetical protein PDJAM_G00006700 [Pangasius djambal]|uniref:Uncharacterized protein n=1 Tax=Pangasius djambal TaxID=1691987 RepID=A0ACC5XYS1_9TELE|nr:hypothetical protein [Pangasius djambal]
MQILGEHTKLWDTGAVRLVLCTESAFSLHIAGKNKTEEYHDILESYSVLSNTFLILFVMCLTPCNIIG